MFGAVTSLGDTLYPAKTLEEGIAQDLNPVAPLIIRTRIFHPLFAIAASIYWIGVVLMLSEGEKDQKLRKLAMSTTGLFTLQLVLGGLNIYLLAPVWMQLVHLFLADAVWLHLVLFTALALAPRAGTVADGSNAARV
jgi:heme A synthase